MEQILWVFYNNFKFVLGVHEDIIIIKNEYIGILGVFFKEGQVRSECLTCTFRASCCSAHLSWAQVPAFTGSSVQDRKKRGAGVRGDRLHWRVQGSTSSPVAGGGWFEVL